MPRPRGKPLNVAEIKDIKDRLRKLGWAYKQLADETGRAYRDRKVGKSVSQRTVNNLLNGVGVSAETREVVLKTLRLGEVERRSRTSPDLFLEDDPDINKLLDHYRGTESHPVTFGGRRKLLDTLDEWREDDGAPQLLLLTGTIDTGKSAALIKWHDSVRGEMDTILYPISKKFRTNHRTKVFKILASELARLHGKALDEKQKDSAECCRQYFQTLLQHDLSDNKKLLLILDGLDELDDESREDLAVLFPSTLGYGVRIVISVRERGGNTIGYWKEKLAWRSEIKSLSIGPLTQSDIQDILREAGVEMSHGTELIRRLHILTSGDPLLVRLYVDDLKKGVIESLDPASLRTMEPGLENYLKAQESFLHGEHVGKVRKVLACSLGHLSRDELSTIADLPSGDYLDDALEKLTHYIIGDDSGYIFSSPRFRDYFFDRLLSKEKKEYEQRFIRWCESHMDDLQNAPTYVIRYYSSHLRRVGDSGVLLALVRCKDWQSARVNRDGTHEGLALDIENAWEAAHQSNESAIKRAGIAKSLGDEVYCSLLLADIRTRASGMSHLSAAARLESGEWSIQKAFDFSTKLLHPEQKTRALLAILDCKVSRWGGIKDRIPWEILASINNIGDEATRSELLSRAVAILPKNLLSNVLEMVQGFGSEWYKSVVLAAIADKSSVLLADDTSMLSKLADQFKDVQAKGKILNAIAPHLEDKDIEQVLQQVDEHIPDEFWKSRIFSSLLKKRRNESCLEEIHERIGRLQRTEYRAGPLFALAASHSGKRTEIFREVLADCNPQIDEQKQGSLADALDNLAPLAELRPSPLTGEHMEKLKEIAGRLSPRYGLRVYASCVLPACEAGSAQRKCQSEYALSLAKGIKDPRQLVMSLIPVIPLLSSSERKSALTMVADAAGKIEPEADRSHALVKLASLKEIRLSDYGEIRQQLIEQARGFSNIRYGAEALFALAAICEDQEEKRDVLAGIWRPVRQLDEFLEGLSALARYLPEDYEPTSKPDFLAAVVRNFTASPERYWYRVDWLARLVTLWGGGEELFAEMKKSIINRIKSEPCKFQALVALSRSAEGEKKEEILQEAKDVRERCMGVASQNGPVASWEDFLRQESLVGSQSDICTDVGECSDKIKLFEEFTESLKKKNLPELLEYLGSRGDVIEKLGGGEAVINTFESIMEIASWDFP